MWYVILKELGDSLTEIWLKDEIGVEIKILYKLPHLPLRETSEKLQL